MRIILGAVLGGIALFMWGFMYWVVLSPMLLPHQPVTDAAALTAAMQTSLPETGVYWMPPKPVHGADVDAATKDRLDQAWMDQHKAGPVSFIIHNVEGKDTEDMMTLARGLVIDIIAALFASILLLSACKGWSYAGRLSFMVGIGLVICAVVHLVNWNFMYAPTDYTIFLIADSMGGWFVAGIVVAAVVKRRAHSEPTYI
ncbi:MAG: hypothetical protein ACYTGG_05205 [Planctomycetota bacterium]|jgi:hypothetical protein